MCQPGSGQAGPTLSSCPRPTAHRAPQRHARHSTCAATLALRCVLAYTPDPSSHRPVPRCNAAHCCGLPFRMYLSHPTVSPSRNTNHRRVCTPSAAACKAVSCCCCYLLLTDRPTDRADGVIRASRHVQEAAIASRRVRQRMRETCMYHCTLTIRGYPWQRTKVTVT